MRLFSRRSAQCAASIFGGWALLASSLIAAPQASIDFSRDIQPILSTTCYTCHGPDEKAREEELRLDVRTPAIKKAIVPGSAAKSPLYQRLLTKDADEHMPPADSKKKPLTPEQIALVKRWIDEGAKYGQHWAYVAPVRPKAPTVKDAPSPVDAFVARSLKQESLKLAQEANPRTLLRRLSFDLTGLPPTSADVDAFVANHSAKAYEAQVDQMIASPQFGERMAIHWLDLVRYGDTNGIHGDNHRDHASYRDYVIKAFNDNKRFDQFTIEQIAGDLLPKATFEQRIASGYNRLNLTTREGGSQAKEFIAKYAADRVRNLSKVWLGVTLECCECHDHKYDPFTQRDFYSLAAYFADVQETPVGSQRAIKLPMILHAEAKKPGPQANILVVQAGKPRMMRILPRGNWQDDSGPEVLPAAPQTLTGLTTPPKDKRTTRKELAQWLISKKNPTVARVFVNRLWKMMFGQGIVSSVDDFGLQGAQPSHPELLDWLAIEFIDSGWNVKHMVKLMAMTRTYRQTSKADANLVKQDPSNRWLARQGRFRLDAEMIRDNALTVSGLLVKKIGGPSVKPYQPAGYWKHLNFPRRTYKHDKGDNQYRRGLYTYWCRTFVHPSLLAFDAPSREACAASRAQSNTPLQALVLLNDPTYVEAARALAVRLIREGGKTPAERIKFAFREALSRPPREGETKVLSALLEKHLVEFKSDAAAATKLINVGESKPPTDINAAELAAWTSLSRVILNLHETISRY
jgi:hypothetical protein